MCSSEMPSGAGSADSDLPAELLGPAACPPGLTQGQKARCECRGSNGSIAPGFSGEKLSLLQATAH